MNIKLDESKKIFFTSDSHAYHKNIVRGTSEWNRENEGKDTRDFDTVEEMSQAIGDGINKYVGPEDILIHLGDWSFAGIDNIYHFKNMLNVREIHLIRGNHDHHIGYGKYFSPSINQELGFPTRPENLFTSVSDVATFQIGKKQIFCSHYAHRVWDHHQHGRWHLYGHSHGSLEDTPYGKSLDVGIDNAYRLYGEYRAFSMHDIQKIMDEREVLLVDHHNSQTT